MKYLLIPLLVILALSKVTLQSGFSKKHNKGLSDNVFYNFLMFATVAVIFSFFLINVGATATTIFHGVIMGVLSICYQVFYICAFSKGKISLTIIINNFSMLIPLFASLMEDINGFLQLKTAFYWRHLAPLTIVIIMTVWITVIAIREKAKLNATYRKVEENLYNIYHASANEVSEEQWEEFLNEYNGESPVQVITSKNEETEE
jgi:hypothetical protein